MTTNAGLENLNECTLRNDSSRNKPQAIKSRGDGVRAEWRTQIHKYMLNVFFGICQPTGASTYPYVQQCIEDIVYVHLKGASFVFLTPSFPFRRLCPAIVDVLDVMLVIIPFIPIRRMLHDVM